MDKIKQGIYYILIAIMSFIALAFLPMLGSSIDVGWEFPQSTAAWMLWAGTRLAVSLLNVLIFHCFVKQGDLNTRKNQNRIDAEKKLNCLKNKEHAPISPTYFFHKEYGKKIPMLFFSTILSLIAFGPAILTFDLITFTTYLTTTIMAVVFGILEMRKVEDYYIEGLLKYANYVEETMEQNKAICKVDMEPTQRLENTDTISDSVCDSIMRSVDTIPISVNNK